MHTAGGKTYVVPMKAETNITKGAPCLVSPSYSVEVLGTVIVPETINLFTILGYGGVVDV
jgi:hypothetical protein